MKEKLQCKEQKTYIDKKQIIYKLSMSPEAHTEHIAGTLKLLSEGYNFSYKFTLSYMLQTNVGLMMVCSCFISHYFS